MSEPAMAKYVPLMSKVKFLTCMEGERDKLVTTEHAHEDKGSTI